MKGPGRSLESGTEGPLGQVRAPFLLPDEIVIPGWTWTRRFSKREQGHNTRCSRRAEMGLVEGISGGWLSEVGRRIKGFGTGGGRK